MTPDTQRKRPVDETPIELEHVTIENEHAPDECAIFPREASEDELATNWLIANGGGFVSLESMR